MNTVLPQCPKCEQHACVVDEFWTWREHDCPDCECYHSVEGLKCLSCGAEHRNASADALADAHERYDDFRAEVGVMPEEFWRAKMTREREKVERLKQGRW